MLFCCLTQTTQLPDLYMMVCFQNSNDKMLFLKVDNNLQFATLLIQTLMYSVKISIKSPLGYSILESELILSRYILMYCRILRIGHGIKITIEKLENNL